MLEEKLFSKYALKKEFGKEFTDFAYDCRIYSIGEKVVLFEPVNKNQYKINGAFIADYQKHLEDKKENVRRNYDSLRAATGNTEKSL